MRTFVHVRNGQIFRMVESDEDETIRDKNLIEITGHRHEKNIKISPECFKVVMFGKKAKLYKKPEVRLEASKLVIEANGIDTSTITFHGMPQETSSIKFEINGNLTDVPANEPLQISSNSDNFISIKCVDDRIFCKNTIQIVAKTFHEN